MCMKNPLRTTHERAASASSVRHDKLRHSHGLEVYRDDFASMIAGSYTTQTAVSNSTTLNPRVLATSGLIRRCRGALRPCAAQGGGRCAGSRDDQPRLQDARTRVGLPPSKRHALASRGWSARPAGSAAGPSGSAWPFSLGCLGVMLARNQRSATMNPPGVAGHDAERGQISGL